MRANPELQIHLAVMEMARWHLDRYPLLQHLIHVPNEGRRTKAGGGILKAMGLVPGVHDLLLLAPCGTGFNGLSLELKAGRNKPTAEQASFAKRQVAVGWACGWTNDAEVAWRFLRWYVTNPTGDWPKGINTEW